MNRGFETRRKGALITARRVLPPSANRRLSCKKRIVRQGRGVSARDRAQTVEVFSSLKTRNNHRTAVELRFSAASQSLFIASSRIPTRRYFGASKTTESEQMTKIIGHNYIWNEMDRYNLLIFQSVANSFPLTD